MRDERSDTAPNVEARRILASLLGSLQNCSERYRDLIQSIWHTCPGTTGYKKPWWSQKVGRFVNDMEEEISRPQLIKKYRDLYSDLVVSGRLPSNEFEHTFLATVHDTNQLIQLEIPQKLKLIEQTRCRASAAALWVDLEEDRFFRSAKDLVRTDPFSFSEGLETFYLLFRRAAQRRRLFSPQSEPSGERTIFLQQVTRILERKRSPNDDDDAYARRLGTNSTTLRRLKKGELRGSYKHLERIAKALGCKPDKLYRSEYDLTLPK